MDGRRSHRESNSRRRARPKARVRASGSGAKGIKTSSHWALSPGPSVCKIDALPLSRRGTCRRRQFETLKIWGARSIAAQRICALRAVAAVVLPAGLELAACGS